MNPWSGPGSIRTPLTEMNAALNQQLKLEWMDAFYSLLSLKTHLILVWSYFQMVAFSIVLPLWLCERE